MGEGEVADLFEDLYGVRAVAPVGAEQAAREPVHGLGEPGSAVGAHGEGEQQRFGPGGDGVAQPAAQGVVGAVAVLLAQLPPGFLAER